MLVLKIIVAFLIVIVCALIGQNKAKKYESREYILRESILLFRGIENEIKYTLATLPNAIESVRTNMKTMLKDVMGAVSLEMLNYNVSNENITKEITKLSSLSAYDIQLITNGLIELGKTDVDGQIGIINMTCASLENQLQDSIELKKKNSKVYKTVGIAMGIIIAIIFI